MTESSTHARTKLISWTWERGGTASVVALEDGALLLRSTVAYPPGAPLIAKSADGVTFEIKVRSCKKLASGPYEISGKLVNATRELRETLAAALAHGHKIEQPMPCQAESQEKRSS